jgi:hypothetical protein
MKSAPFSRLVLDADDELAAWLGERLGLKFVPPFTTIGFANEDGIQAVALFNNYTGTDIELTLHADGMMDRHMCRVISDMVFNVNGCARCTARTRADNPRALKVLKVAGWKQEGVLREYFSGTDAVLFGMLKRECRFLK